MDGTFLQPLLKRVPRTASYQFLNFFVSLLLVFYFQYQIFRVNPSLSYKRTEKNGTPYLSSVIRNATTCLQCSTFCALHLQEHVSELSPFFTDIQTSFGVLYRSVDERHNAKKSILSSSSLHIPYVTMFFIAKEPSLRGRE